MRISSTPRYVPGEVLVKLRKAEPSTAESSASFVDDHGGKVLKKFDLSSDMLDSFQGELLHLALPQGLSADEAVKQWKNDPRVEYVATNDILFGKPSSDPVKDGKLNPQSWGLHNVGQTGGTVDADIDAVEAWDQQSGKGSNSNGPIIAVIDTGVDFLHEALRENVWTNPNEVKDGVDNDGNGVIDDIHGYDAREENGYPLDDNGHGTHCAAIIGAADGNSEKISGVMKRSQVAGVRFLNRLGLGKLSDAIEGIVYADKIGARIVSNSWGGGAFNPAMYDVLKASPALHVFAAGNEGNDDDKQPSYPSAYNLPNIVSVAATDHNDQLADFSNYGSRTVDLAAPGVDIHSAVHGGEYKTLSGTSMAAPFVAGAAGLLVSEYPEITNQQIKKRLMNSVDRVPSLEDKVVSGGRLNVAAALERDEVPPAPVTSLAVSQSQPGRLELRFVSTGDDGLAGEAARYVVRMSESEDFEKSTVVAQGRPSLPGREQKLSLRTPQWGEDKHLNFRVTMEDNVGNESVSDTRTLEVKGVPTAFEPGEAGDKETWTSRWDFAQVEDSERGKVWTDSPGGNHTKTSTWLRSKSIDLAGLQEPKLVFEAKTDLEDGHDFLDIEIGRQVTRGVWQYRTVQRLTGNSDWNVHEVDLSKYKGEDIRLSFYLRPDGSGSQDGVYLDNISVVGAPPSSTSKA